MCLKTVSWLSASEAQAGSTLHHVTHESTLPSRIQCPGSAAGTLAVDQVPTAGLLSVSDPDLTTDIIAAILVLVLEITKVLRKFVPKKN